MDLIGLNKLARLTNQRRKALLRDIREVEAKLGIVLLVQRGRGKKIFVIRSILQFLHMPATREINERLTRLEGRMQSIEGRVDDIESVTS